MNANTVNIIRFLATLEMTVLPNFRTGTNYYMVGYSKRTEDENRIVLQTLVSFLVFTNIFIVGIAYIGLHYYLSYSNSTFNTFPLGIVVLITSATSIGVGFWQLKMRFDQKSFKYFMFSTSSMLFNIDGLVKSRKLDLLPQHID